MEESSIDNLRINLKGPSDRTLKRRMEKSCSMSQSPKLPRVEITNENHENLDLEASEINLTSNTSINSHYQRNQINILNVIEDNSNNIPFISSFL